MAVKLPKYFNPRKSRVKITVVNYRVIFYNIGPRLDRPDFKAQQKVFYCYAASVSLC
jgi:hypothetical protein